MKTLPFAAVLVGVWLASAPLAGRGADPDKDLQGTWVAVSIEINGTPAPVYEAKRPRFTFKGEKLLVRHEKDGGKEVEWAYKIDPNKSPKQIDIEFDQTSETKKSLYGIYEAKGDELKVCWGFTAKNRPTKFATNKEEELVLIVFKKQASAAAADAAQEKAKKLDEQAKAVAEKFTKAFLVDMNVDSVMKVVAVPYISAVPYTSITGDPKDEEKAQVLKKVEDVRKQFLAVMEGKKPLTGKLTFGEGGEVITYENLTVIKKLPEELRKALDEVLKKSDRLVAVHGNKDDASFAEILTFVSWRDGEAKVVGHSLGFVPRKNQK